MIDRSIALYKSNSIKIGRNELFEIEIEFVHMTEMDVAINNTIDLFFIMLFCC